MNSSSQQFNNMHSEERPLAQTPSAPSMPTSSQKDTPSRGERALPFLFAAMETCCIDAVLIGLASIGFLGSSEPLLPLWLPFVLLAGACWAARLLMRRTGSSRLSLDTLRDGKGFLLVVSLVCTLTILLLLAAATLFRLDFFRSFGVTTLCLCLCWRGIYLAERGLDPDYALKTLRLGIGAILLVLII